MTRSDQSGFGPATAAFVVVSSMVGTGVLTTSGYAVLGVKSHALVLVLWGVGGLIALAGALTLAELSAMLPKSGGEYVVLRAAYGPASAFLAGWVSLLLGFAAPIAATASASANVRVGRVGNPRPADDLRRGERLHRRLRGGQRGGKHAGVASSRRNHDRQGCDVDRVRRGGVVGGGTGAVRGD